MNCKNLTRVARDYLNVYESILQNMICRMNSADLNSSISHNFIVQMLPHHRAAIEMSRNILKYTTDEDLMNIATSIISEQTKSIANMREVLCLCDRIHNSSRELCSFQERIDCIKKTMFSGMRSACADNDINSDFIREMIPHHRGAVEMSKTTLEFDICSQLKPILDAIITSQERGIRQMEDLLERINKRTSFCK